MDSFRWLSFTFFFFIVFSSCKWEPTQVSKGYYFWRTGDHITDAERSFVSQHKINKVYARILDVGWSDMLGAIPVSSGTTGELERHLNLKDSLPVDVIPVVFITNKTFERIDTNDLKQLALRVARRCLPAYDDIDRNYEAANYPYKQVGQWQPSEIQIDCDWTESTKKNYFRFLKHLKSFINADSTVLSATIRLHQFKYFNKTGTPPVNRGMLMIYNISDPKKYSTENSIYEEDKAAAYFNKSEKYPLPLDIALPAWSWSIVYRNKKFYQIENAVTERDLKELDFLQAGPGHFYLVTKDTVYRDIYLRKGDEIKAEGIDEKALLSATRLAQKAVNSKEFTVSLFELSEKEINNYSNETFDKVYGSFP
jgi:hypothetical protein